jgi:hypothetical protein
MALNDNCLNQVRQLYTQFTGLEISAAVAQVRAELTAQRDHEQSTESVTTYKYNHTIQEEIGPVVITQQTKETKKRTTKQSTIKEE